MPQESLNSESGLKTRRIFRHDYTASSSNPDPLRIANVPPPWRTFGGKTDNNGSFQERIMTDDQVRRGSTYQVGENEAQMINAALVLRRPLLITGHAGVGKTSLAYAVAWQLGLGNVLRWSITSRSALKDALYEYDAIGRLQDASLHKSGIEGMSPQSIGQYITLGPLGTALLPNRSGPYQPRVPSY